METLPLVRELQKATVTRQGQKLSLTGYNERKAINTNLDLCQKLCSSKFALQWGISISQMRGQYALISALSRSLGYAMSDGSFKDEKGSKAWIIKGPTSAL